MFGDGLEVFVKIQVLFYFKLYTDKAYLVASRKICHLTMKRHCGDGDRLCKVSSWY